MPLITAHASETSAPRSTYSVMGPLAVGFMRCSFVRVGRDSEGLCGGDSARAWGSLGRSEDEPPGSHFSESLPPRFTRCPPRRFAPWLCWEGPARGGPLRRLRPGHRGHTQLRKGGKTNGY